MNIFNTLEPGNIYEIIQDGKEFFLYEKTRQIYIVSSEICDELIIYAQANNMISGDAVIIGA